MRFSLLCINQTATEKVAYRRLDICFLCTFVLYVERRKWRDKEGDERDRGRDVFGGIGNDGGSLRAWALHKDFRGGGPLYLI